MRCASRVTVSRLCFARAGAGFLEASVDNDQKPTMTEQELWEWLRYDEASLSPDVQSSTP